MKTTGGVGIVLPLPERQAVSDGTLDDLLIRIETEHVEIIILTGENVILGAAKDLGS